MKKLFALMLCAALLLCGTAFAETAEPAAAQKEYLGTLNVNGAFEIKCKIPEGYTVNIIDSTNTMITAVVSSQDKNKPTIITNVAFSDMYTVDGKALKMNDLTEEELAEIQATFMDQMDDVTFEYTESAYGTKLMIVRGKINDVSVVDFYSVYESYEIDCVVTFEPDSEVTTLSEEQVAMMLDFFSEMDFNKM